MKKLLSVLIIALLLNGCRYINTTEPYVDAKETPKLTVPEGLDDPNSSSLLEIPKANSNGVVASDSNINPPDMPIRTQQSEDSKKRIDNRDGFAVLSVKSDVSEAWAAMSQLKVENWSVTQSNQDDCSVSLHYDDAEARDRENAGFLKKMFTRDKYYTDYTADFNLTCKQVGSVIEIKLAQKDGSVAKSFLADNVMNNLYDQF